MPVPASIDDLSPTASSNSPAGGETPKDGDNYIRALSGFVAELRDKLDGTSDTGTIKNATFSGTMAGAASWSDLQTFASGISVGTSGGNVYASTYTPTTTNTSNVTSSTPSTAFYTRSADIVTVFGSVVVTPTTQSNSTSLGISLPIASNLVATTDLAGVATSGNGDNQFTGAIITGDATNNRASLSFLAMTGSGGSLSTWCYSFSYAVL